MSAPAKDAAREVMGMLRRAREDRPRRAELGGAKGPWLVYGAGLMGRKLAKALAASGRDVVGFMDAKKEGSADGLPILGLAQALSLGLASANVALGLHNPMVDASATRSELLKAGFGKAWMPQEFVEALPEMANFWLAPVEALAELSEEAAFSALSCYGDEASARLVLGIARWRLLGLSDELPEPDVAGQYFPDDLPSMPPRVRVVDCGAYVGDTLRALRERGFEVEGYAGLEPDPANYAKLVAEAARSGPGARVCVPCGAWDKPDMLAFLPNDAAGSVKEGPAGEGMIRIQCLSVDDAFCSMEPNFIKMDIEGAESRALAGCARTIELWQPRLAISSYHAPMDLWLLPNQIKSLMMQREKEAPAMALRGHSKSSFDSVIYAWRP